jgi:hypothetical protein
MRRNGYLKYMLMETFILLPQGLIGVSLLVFLFSVSLPLTAAVLTTIWNSVLFIVLGANKTRGSLCMIINILQSYETHARAIPLGV